MSRPGHGGLMPVNGLGFPPQNVARVVVWEWLSEHSRWRPYTATVCHHIENVLKEDARGSVVLGQVDAQLVPYVIDLQSMHQFRQDTGEQTPHPPQATRPAVPLPPPPPPLPPLPCSMGC
ncbi:E3 ubiquitin-protein ligase dtx1 [Saguinus oedipus]|uniref:E3 ubiquitin-protein ligase dtx1 n=1 Tax=Saguinus oedipus TaxID=9490 RepID=A0ABQ9UZU2_SAGOE|nr:E3 ubiquitin-protein ligase dtx1 [Saguinus oedipus]